MSLPKTISLEEAAERAHVSPERLRTLAVGGFCPHILIDGQTFRFRIADLNKWVRDNLWAFKEGKDFTHSILPPYILNSLTPADHRNVPMSISNLRGLMVMDAPHPVVGVYFLCREGEVVYVGQSTNLFSRVSVHHKDKKFDSVFYLLVHEELLDDIERAFIKALKPEYNGQKIACLSDDEAQAVLSEYGVFEEAEACSEESSSDSD